jgi:L-2-hydroxyglutarate oxidase LhgO
LNDFIDTVVVGAGVIGLAIARAIAQRGRDVVVVERHSRKGEETSSRNSGVVHSGIYYPTASHKARFCVLGKTMLYEYCSRRDIPHQRCGKLLVAQEDQLPKLRALLETGRRNGVTDLEWLDATAARKLEPEVNCHSAVWSPSTGIIDVHAYMDSLQADIEAAGGTVVLKAEFMSARANADGFEITTRAGEESSTIDCRWLINAAGLNAPQILRRVDGYPSSRLRKGYLAKGNYFSCRGPSPFRHLVYPMPNEAGLGVHATLDLAGRTRFGPDVQWIDEVDYTIDASRSASFYDAIREYWPGLPDDALQADYTGIRPKISGPGEPAADFEIETEATHGIPGLVNLLGIESPGLTSSLAIGDHVGSLRG